MAPRGEVTHIPRDDLPLRVGAITKEHRDLRRPGGALLGGDEGAPRADLFQNSERRNMSVTGMLVGNITSVAYVRFGSPSPAQFDVVARLALFADIVVLFAIVCVMDLVFCYYLNNII